MKNLIRWQKELSEESVAKDIGAKLIKNSGRGRKKGDMQWKDFVIDVKEGKSFALTEASWAKMCTDTYKNGIQYEPMILRVLPNGAKIACIPFDFLEELYHGIEE